MKFSSFRGHVQILARTGSVNGRYKGCFHFLLVLGLQAAVGG